MKATLAVLEFFIFYFLFVLSFALFKAHVCGQTAGLYNAPVRTFLLIGLIRVYIWLPLLIYRFVVRLTKRRIYHILSIVLLLAYTSFYFIGTLCYTLAGKYQWSSLLRYDFTADFVGLVVIIVLMRIYESFVSPAID